ncbi:MAG: hypothetical protein JXQ74_04650 [Alphaproteobacteria bacterium]|nr:hypothetical protein [Alphaproteobacteria bacterium]
MPKKFQTTGTVYALIFSSNITQINNKIIKDGFFKTTIKDFSKKGSWELKSQRAFQGLLIIQSDRKEWISNLYFTGTSFKQGPWISTSLKQLHEKFVIQIETNKTEKLKIQIESSVPLFFKTKHKKQDDGEWIFSDKPKSIKGIIDTSKEARPLLTSYNGTGYGTSVTLKLNKRPKEKHPLSSCIKNKPEKFNVKKCIRCEHNQICKVIPALEKNTLG